MAVTERWKERPYGSTIDKDGNVTWTATRVFDVDGVTTEDEAIAAVPDAAYGSGHPRNNELTVSSQSALEERKGLWAVRVGYKSDPLAGDTGQGTPLIRPPQFRFEKGSITVDVDTEILGSPRLNSALDPFDPFPRTIKTRFYTVTMDAPFFEDNLAELYENAINDDEFATPFGTFKPLEVMCTGIAPVGDVLLTERKVRVAYEFEIRRLSAYPKMPANVSPFDDIQIDQGFHSWVVVTGETPQPCDLRLKGSLQPVTTPVRLNADGTPIDQTSIVGLPKGTFKSPPAAPNGATFFDSGNCKRVAYQQYPRVAFKGLNLPNSR